MEIVDVQSLTPVVAASRPIRVIFNVVGAVAPFEFPFSNESLTENKIEFIVFDET